MSEQPSNAKTHGEIMAVQSSFGYPNQLSLLDTEESGEGSKGSIDVPLFSESWKVRES